MNKTIKYSLIGFFGVPALFIAASAIILSIGPKSAKAVTYTPPQNTAIQEAPRQETKPIPHYVIEKIAIDFEENNLAADKKYNYKPFTMNATINSIDSDILGNPYVIATGTSKRVSFQLLFKQEQSDALSKLKTGIVIKVSCSGGINKMLGSFVASDCELM